jgi:mannose-6-phosphate isomerase class I
VSRRFVVRVHPADAAAFEALAGRLHETEEWSYVEREVDVRLWRR